VTFRHRIAHVITRLDLGGAQQNTLYSCAHHDRERFEVALVAGSGGLLDDEARGLDGVDVRLVPWLRHEISPWDDTAAVVRLARLFGDLGVDLVHTHSSKAGILARAAARIAGVPRVVHTVHGWSFNDTQPAFVQGLYAALERWAARGTDRIVTVSTLNVDKGLALGIGERAQYRVIHSGIDLAEFRRPRGAGEAVRRELGIAPGQRLVGTVACLKPQKAPLDFVRAAALAHRADPTLRFAIAGDGELRAEVESEIRAHGMQGAVRLLGWRRDVPEILAALDLFVLTSRFEGLPRVVLQAMAAGVPVVATAVDGTPEVVHDGETGLLVPPADPQEAAVAILRMVRERALAERCAAEAGRRLSGEFDSRRMVRDLDDLYAELLSGTAPPTSPRRTGTGP